MRHIARRSRPVATAIAAMALVWIEPAMADSGVYTFVDSRGVSHFTNVPSDSRYVPIVKPRKAKQQPRAPQNWGYDGLIRLTAAEHRVSPALVKAVIAAESSFNQLAVSKKGAQGLMQLMPQTAAELGVMDAFSADQNVDGGARYLREMLDRYGDLHRAIAAYNAGPTAVDRYRGIPPYRETRDYVKRVLTYYRHYHGDFGQ
jgi:soluble lytic murein transglycosylase-like protein